MTEMNNLEYAASLRILRRISGMLHHPDAHKVFFNLPEVHLQKIVYLQIKLANACQLTADEIAAYGKAGAKDIQVVEKENGEFVFENAELDPV